MMVHRNETLRPVLGVLTVKQTLLRPKPALLVVPSILIRKKRR